MLVKRLALALFVIAFLAGVAFGQNITSNILGTVVDPGDAVVPNVDVQLKSEVTGDVRTAKTNEFGIFRFNSILNGSYTLTLKGQSGFKTYTQAGIALSASETRDLGKIKMELGSITDTVSVTANVVNVQTASSEKSSLVDTNQLSQLAVKGRDLFGMLVLLPGVTAQGQELVSNGGLSTVTVNGEGMGKHAFMVDGVSDMDTGANNATHFTPNLDSIAEIKVLTSNYQAEYGRQSGAQIQVITKGGGQEFHGSAWTNKRHEMFNAKSFSRNLNNQQKDIYRYFLYGYSIGGPVYIPKTWNTDKRRLFFFASNEWTKQRVLAGQGYYNLPTALERNGDFSQSWDNNCQTLAGAGCKLTQLKDPTTGIDIPGNNLRNAGYLGDPYGLAMLNFFPAVNRCDLTNNAAGCWNEGQYKEYYGTKRNYMYSFSPSTPFRNDTYRFDVNLTSKVTGWVRYGNNSKTSQSGAQYYLKNAAGQWAQSFQYQPNSGHGWASGITMTLTPTIVNEFNFGKSWNTWSFYPNDDSMLDRNRMNNPPSFADLSKDPNILAEKNAQRPGFNTGPLNYMYGIPSVSFGGLLSSNQANISFTGSGGQLPYANWNNIYTFNDNLTWVRGTHNFKTGIYFERTGKAQQSNNGSYLGNYNFAATTSNAADSRNGYANAYLGNFQYYNEGKRVVGDFWFTSVEFYLQDNWRIRKNLTLDIGVRFYHSPPIVNENDSTAVWLRSAYVPGGSARIYYPACSATGCSSQRAYDRNNPNPDPTKDYTYAALIGTFVPNTGSYYNGNVKAGTGGVPMGLYHVDPIVPALRLGLSWDVFGDGRTALRTGFGQSFNRGDANQVMFFAGAPPVTQSQTVYYSKISDIPNLKNMGAVSPSGTGGITGNQKLENTMSTSFGIQQNVGFGTMVDASYVGSFRRHGSQSRQMNAIPMFSQYDPNNINPVNAYLPVLSTNRAYADNYLRPMLGVGGVTASEFRSTSNYHALQVSVTRSMTRGMSYTIAYTMGKTFTPGSSTYDYIPFFKARNKSVSYQGAPHVITASYVYQIPNLGRRLGIRALGFITDNWQLSGISQFQSHGRTGVPGININASGTNSPNWTGSAEGARYLVVGDLNGAHLNAAGEAAPSADFYHSYNWKALALPSQCSWTPGATPQQGIGQSMACFGNAGGGNLIAIPTIMNNHDLVLSKSFKLKSERRKVTFRAEAYNFLNHTQISGYNNSPQFDYNQWRLDGTAKNVNNTLGQANGWRDPRKISANLRFEF